MSRLVALWTLCVALAWPSGAALGQRPRDEPTGAADPYREESERAADDDAERALDEDEPATPPPSAPAPTETEQPEGAVEVEEGPNEGTTAWLVPEPQGEALGSRLIIPPLYLEQRGDVSTTAVFPFFFERSAPEDYQLQAGLYYYRRSAALNADVLFPLFWSFRTVDSLTFSIPPVLYHTDEDGFDFAIAPLFFDGRSGSSVYTVIPPLLTVSWADDESAYTFAGPFWRIRDGQDLSWGIFPLLWVNEELEGSMIVAPPLFFRFVDQVERSALTIVPPVYHRITPDSVSWGLAPLLLHSHDEDGFAWTIPPALFHYSRDGEDTRLITPLFGWFDVETETTLITPLYQNHRGETELDAVFPIFWSWRDRRQHASALVIPPIFYHFESPAENTNIVFPLFGRWHEEGLYTTWATPLVAHYDSHEDDSAGTWVFPNIQVSHTPTSNTFNLHPLVYSTSATTHRHLVIAPLYWDFEDYEDRSRVTIGFPLLWRFRNGSTVSQLAGNTYYHYYREGGVPGWEFHFFPLFSYGEPRPGDHWWNILFGLVGYQRQGPYARVRAFWLPFQVDGPESTTVSTR